MTEYRIHDLERLSGIKAHTIRIWEKRYGLIEPLRTATNRRTYSSDQLVKLMNVSALLEQGYKISAVAALPDADIAALIEQLHKERPGIPSAAIYINTLTTAMMVFDERAFETAFANAVRELGVMGTMMWVVYPFLRKTGLLWRTEKVAPIQEHFASCIIRNKLIVAIEELPPAASKNDPYMLFLPPHEWHELPLLLANYVIRSQGHHTIYLGQSVPYEDISTIVDAVKPACMLTFFTTPRAPHQLSQELQAVASRFPSVKLFFSGDPSMLNELIVRRKNAVRLENVEELLKFIR